MCKKKKCQKGGVVKKFFYGSKIVFIFHLGGERLVWKIRIKYFKRGCILGRGPL